MSWLLHFTSPYQVLCEPLGKNYPSSVPQSTDASHPSSPHPRDLSLTFTSTSLVSTLFSPDSGFSVDLTTAQVSLSAGYMGFVLKTIFIFKIKSTNFNWRDTWNFYKCLMIMVNRMIWWYLIPFSAWGSDWKEVFHPIVLLLTGALSGCLRSHWRHKTLSTCVQFPGPSRKCPVIL